MLPRIDFDLHFQGQFSTRSIRLEWPRVGWTKSCDVNSTLYWFELLKLLLNQQGQIFWWSWLIDLLLIVYNHIS